MYRHPLVAPNTVVRQDQLRLAASDRTTIWQQRLVGHRVIARPSHATPSSEADRDCQGIPTDENGAGLSACRKPSAEGWRPISFGQQQQMSSNSDFLNLTHRLDTRPETDIRDHPVPRVETKGVRPSVFATKISDKAVRFRGDPADPYPVIGEGHRSDAEASAMGVGCHTAGAPPFRLLGYPQLYSLQVGMFSSLWFIAVFSGPWRIRASVRPRTFPPRHAPPTRATPSFAGRSLPASRTTPVESSPTHDGTLAFFPFSASSCHPFVRPLLQTGVAPQYTRVVHGV